MKQVAINFQEIVESFPNAIFLIDQDYKIHYCNEKGKILSLSSDFITCIIEEDNVKKLISRKTSALDVTSHENGKTFHVVSKKMGELYLFEVKDISLISQMEKSVESQRALQNRLMVSSERVKIISSIAHEVNNPLMIINGNVDIMKNILQSGFDAEKANNLLASSKRAINRIFHVLNEKSSLNKLESFDEIKKVNLYQFCNDLFDFFSDQIRIDCIDVKLDMSLNKDVFIRSSLLKFTLVELIDNALFFMQEDESGNRYIRVSLDMDKDSAFIYFHNSGSDIVIDHYHQMFEPFFTSKKSSDGTGVGLYHTKQALIKYGSDIFYDDSQKDVCFIVQLKIEHTEG